MRRFSYEEFEAQTDAVFALAERGEDVVLTRDGRDIFYLRPCEPSDNGPPDPATQ